MTEVERAKNELLVYARQHDAARAARRKPARAMLIAAGVGLLVGRVLLGGAKKGVGGRLMGVVFAARMAAVYGPVVLRAIGDARRAYRSAVATDRGAPARKDIQDVTVVRREPSFLIAEHRQ